MSASVFHSRFAWLLIPLLAVSSFVSAQTQKKKLGWPTQIVLVRDELTPAGSLGHLLVNGKQVGVTLEPNGEMAQITVSRAHLHRSVAGDREDYAIVLDDLDDGDSGNKLQFHLGDLEDKSEGCVLIGTSYEPNVVIADTSTDAGKKLLHEIQQEKSAGKDIQYALEGNVLRLTSVKPVQSSEALANLRRALYGTGDVNEKNLVVNFDFRASDEYKAQALGISESIARQLTIDERQFVIKALEIPSETPGTATVPGAPGVKPATPGASDPKAPASTKLLPQKPGDEHDSVEQGFKRSAEPDQPTTFDNKPTPPAQDTEKKKKQPPPD